MEVITPDFIISGRDKIDCFSGEVSGQLRETRKLLYVSGPMYSEGWLAVNINLAVEAAELAYERGWAPVVPHLDVLIQMITRITNRDRYMDVDLALIKASSAVLVLPYSVEFKDGVQTGTSEELDFAQDCGIPVYTSQTLPWIN